MDYYSICCILLTSLFCVGHSNTPLNSQLSAVQADDGDNEAGRWNVTVLNTTCILLQGIIELTVNYTDINNQTRLGNVVVPKSARATGACGALDQFIILTWQHDNASQAHDVNTLTFTFHSNDTANQYVRTKMTGIPSGKYGLSGVTSVINKDAPVFPNASDPSVPFMPSKNGILLFPTALSHSFACDATATIGSSKEPLTVVLKSFQIEAFRKVSKTEPDNGLFSAAEHCATDEISSGSVVGTVIISILSIVLIALGVAAVATYVLKKQRAASTASGYENM